MSKLGDYVLSGQVLNRNVVASIDDITSSGGESGNSDFTTAQVTITESNATGAVIGAWVVDGVQGITGTVPMAQVNLGDSIVNTLVLYKGVGIVLMEISDGVNIDVSGNITQLANRMYSITGDCTITLSSGSVNPSE